MVYYGFSSTQMGKFTNNHTKTYGYHAKTKELDMILMDIYGICLCG
jgi:hypothetical protein